MALDWLPILHDRAPRRAHRLRADEVAPLAAATIPVPDILATLTFFPVLPSPQPRRRRPRTNPPEVITPYMDAVRPLTWAPITSARVFHRRRPLSLIETTAPPAGAVVVVAQQQAWAPQLPDRLKRRRLIPTEAVYVTPPLIIAAAFGCLALIDTSLTVPLLLTETVTRSDLLSETLTAPTFLAEDFC